TWPPAYQQVPHNQWLPRADVPISGPDAANIDRKCDAARRSVPIWEDVMVHKIFPVFAVLASMFIVACPPASGQQKPNVVVLATGGTIAGTADVRSAAGYNAGAVSAEQLVASVPGLDKIANLRAEQISSIGSQDMNDEVWLKLARRIEELEKS